MPTLLSSRDRFSDTMEVLDVPTNSSRSAWAPCPPPCQAPLFLRPQSPHTTIALGRVVTPRPPLRGAAATNDRTMLAVQHLCSPRDAEVTVKLWGVLRGVGAGLAREGRPGWRRGAPMTGSLAFLMKPSDCVAQKLPAQSR